MMGYDGFWMPEDFDEYDDLANLADPPTVPLFMNEHLIARGVQSFETDFKQWCNTPEGQRAIERASWNL